MGIKERTISKDQKAELPNYGISEAAAMVGVPRSTARAWVLGQAGFEPVIRIADRDAKLVSFRNLVEMHVLAALRREHKVPLQRVRRGVEFLRRRLDVREPLASSQLLTDGRDLLVECAGTLLNVSRYGQLEMQQVVEAYLARVDLSPKGAPLRLYPFGGRSRLDAKRSIVIDPAVQFGRPCIVGTGVSTAEIADRFRSGEPIRRIARDYDCSQANIEEAIRFEQAA